MNEFFKATADLFGFLDIFSGGACAGSSAFALGIMPTSRRRSSCSS
jgi:preprotein translocase subunit SecY